MRHALSHLRWRLDGAIASWRRVRLAGAAGSLLAGLPDVADAEPWRLHLLEDGGVLQAPAPDWASAHLRLDVLARAPALRRRIRAAWRSGARHLDLFPPDGAGRPALAWVGDPERVRGVFRPPPP